MPWREAATLILVARSSSKANLRQHATDYRVLLMKRSAKSSFSASRHVFPGGVVSDSDHSSHWTSLFSKLTSGQNLQAWTSTFQAMTHQPAMYGDKEWALHPALAFRICAIRETFEESGILMARSKQGVVDLVSGSKNGDKHATTGTAFSFDGGDLEAWRKRVHDDADKFVTMCETLEVFPDVWCLYDWSNWLTPVQEPKRFDTMFYIACLDSIQQASHDFKETTQATWFHPQDAVEGSHKGELSIMPPQVYELSVLQRMKDFDQLRGYIPLHQGLGVERTMPVIAVCKDGILVVNKGDDLYPDDPVYEGPGEMLQLDETVQEVATRCQHLNRTIRDGGGKVFMLLCNTARIQGQLMPVNRLMPEESSQL